MGLINDFRHAAVIITCIGFLYTYRGIFRRLVAMVTSLLHDPYVASEILFPDGKLHPWTRMAFVNLPKKSNNFPFLPKCHQLCNGSL